MAGLDMPNPPHLSKTCTSSLKNVTDGASPIRSGACSAEFHFYQFGLDKRIHIINVLYGRGSAC